MCDILWTLRGVDHVPRSRSGTPIDALLLAVFLLTSFV
jgi:hypothetical protein